MVHLVWDMDGTLLDSTQVVPDAFVATVKELGVLDVDREKVVAAYPLGVPEAMLEHLVGRRVSKIEADSYYDRLRRSSVSAYDGVLDALAELRRRGLPIVVFTGASSRAADTLLQSAGIEPDILIGGDHVAHPKPAPDGVLIAAHLLDIAAADIVYIGDAPTDLQAAHAAGARGAAATWGHLYRADEPAELRLSAPDDALTLLDIDRSELSRRSGPA